MNSSSKPLQVIFFDVGGTLLHPQPSVAEVYQRVAQEHGFEISSGEIRKQFRQAFQQQSKIPLDSVAREVSWWRTIVDNTLGSWVDESAMESVFRDLWTVYASPKVWRIAEDAIAVLETLKNREIKLGIISNWDSRLLSLLDSLALSRYFDTIQVSALAGVAKPDPRIFEKALNAVRASAERSLHVGDSVENDLLAPRKMGMQSVLLRSSSEGSLSLANEDRIHSFRELLDLV
ncbi:MAG: HAD-IA family hydrolase [Okeania sp. SIO1H5]|uniref:HAD-IA family hydrolase n=1 Tax=Okeania sp. SIO1H5 TaxID=2607777 RepID=UPI0013B61AD9|nr:HAD-IA family hydrolase [Okeania sp. SIO1H5]NET23865.1 HAD-IA family hydrolase [Okeania sp. SIO1H5]